MKHSEHSSTRPAAKKSGSPSQRVDSATPDGVRREHERYSVDLEVNVCSESNFCAGLAENLSAGGLFIATHKLQKVGSKIELSLRMPDSEEVYQIVGEVRWVRLVGMCLRDAAGVPVRWAGSVTDITEQKRAEEELKRLEGQLRHAQRLEAVGTLAGGVAHDFNNILGAILGYGEMALRDAPPGSRLRRDVESILTAGERGRALVERILAFSRSGVGERVAVHVEAVVREALELLSASLPDNVRIECELRAGRAAMLGDPTQVHQVLMNVATNGIQAMAGSGGTLNVSLEALHLDAPRLATTGPIAAGGWIVLKILDSGVGIAPEIVERIFDPFFTTKEVGKGTGLGLSTVVGIVKSHGGFVRLQSILGRGSDFQVYLPAVPDGKEKIDSSRDSAIARGHGELLLVVDDEEVIRDVVRAVLVQHGYRVITAQDGADATNQFARQPNEIEAVITDLDMPVMDGVTLIRVLRKINPDLPIIISTGIASNSARGGSNREIESLGVKTILKKPYTAETVLQAVHRLFI